MKKKKISFLEEESIEVSLTPLIDTVLVLLIVFIMVSPVLENALKISLPQVKNEYKIATDDCFCFAINQYGKLFLKNKEQTSKEFLSKKINEEKVKNKKILVVLFADKDLLLETVIDLIDYIKKETGIENVYIKTKKISF